MARNDPAKQVSEPESRDFMLAVRRIKDELDPDGTLLDLHDTGTDMELFPRVPGGRASFDKGDGVAALDTKLNLGVKDGPNVVCGDTDSDVSMIIQTLTSMCGESMVDIWQERLRKELEPEHNADDTEETDDEGEREKKLAEDLVDLDEAKKEERRLAQEQEEKEKAEARAREEDDAKEIGKKLAVIFVIPPEGGKEGIIQEDKVEKKKKLAFRVQKWCEYSGAHCAIVTSPDVLVYALANFATKFVIHRRVTDPPSGPDRQDSDADGDATPRESDGREASERLSEVRRSSRAQRSNTWASQDSDGSPSFNPPERLAARSATVSDAADILLQSENLQARWEDNDRKALEKQGVPTQSDSASDADALLQRVSSERSQTDA